MRLGLFTSRAGSVPNLVSLQHPRLTALPTVLVCPMQSSLAMTPLRAKAVWGGESYVIACDLLRPINRRILRPLGELDEQSSRKILETFARLLASPA